MLMLDLEYCYGCIYYNDNQDCEIGYILPQPSCFDYTGRSEYGSAIETVSDDEDDVRPLRDDERHYKIKV